MKSDFIAVEDCVKDLGLDTRKVLTEIFETIAMQVDKLGYQGSRELVGAMIRAGYIPKDCPKQEKVKEKFERDWFLKSNE